MMKKQCTRCQEIKPLDDFYTNKMGKLGRHSICKTCHAKRRRTPEARQKQREYNRKYFHTKRGRKKVKAGQKKWRQSEKGKASQRKRYKKWSKTEGGRKTRATANRRYAERNPEKAKAQKAAQYEVSVGKLPHPKSLSCVDCNQQAEHYHHPNYSKPLDVVALCIPCHRKRHS
jgi:hypothetical protein